MIHFTFLQSRVVKSALLLALMMTTLSFAAEAQKKKQGKPTLRHVVLFKFKDNASAADVQKVEAAFAALPGAIPQIKNFEWGTNNSPENLNQGLTHCFLLTFNSEKDRDEYLVHPEHKKFGSVVGPYIDKVTVVDYWVK